MGQLRTPIGVYTAEETPDGRGGFETRWIFHSRLWAHIEARLSREIDRNGRRTVTQNYQVTTRYCRDLPERIRVLWGDRILRVIAVSDPDARQERLHFMCEEEQQ